MSVLRSVLLLVSSLIIVSSCAQSSTKKVLVFSKTAGYRHESIETGITLVKQLGTENNFQVIASENAAYFSKDSLAQFDVILFLSTTGDILNKAQESSMEAFMQAGGGFVGVHAATDTEYEWPWYGKMVGGYFKSHPDQQKAKVVIKDATHPSTKHLPAVWTHFDEWYNFKNLNNDMQVLLTLDESSYKGGENGENHPIAWYQEYDGGKMFYTGLGHTKEAYADPNFIAHLLGGLQYVMGQ